MMKNPVTHISPYLCRQPASVLFSFPIPKTIGYCEVFENKLEKNPVEEADSDLLSVIHRYLYLY